MPYGVWIAFKGGCLNRSQYVYWLHEFPRVHPAPGEEEEEVQRLNIDSLYHCLLSRPGFSISLYPIRGHDGLWQSVCKCSHVHSKWAEAGWEPNAPDIQDIRGNFLLQSLLCILNGSSRDLWMGEVGVMRGLHSSGLHPKKPCGQTDPTRSTQPVTVKHSHTEWKTFIYMKFIGIYRNLYRIY